MRIWHVIAIALAVSIGSASSSDDQLSKFLETDPRLRDASALFIDSRGKDRRKPFDDIVDALFTYKRRLQIVGEPSFSRFFEARKELPKSLILAIFGEPDFRDIDHNSVTYELLSKHDIDKATFFFNGAKLIDGCRTQKPDSE